MLIQERPEETSPKGFQMGQMLRSPGCSKSHECNHIGPRLAFSVMALLFFLVLGTCYELVGAISSTEPPLSFNANAGTRPPGPGGNGGDELGASERDVFPSSGVTDYPTSSASKFASNGQFARSSLTAEKSTTSAPPHFSTQESSTTLSTEAYPSQLSPLSPIVQVDGGNGNENDGKWKSNLGTQQDAADKSSRTTTMGPEPLPRPKSATTGSEEVGREKPTNINLLRKLWSSTRSSKLNLTHEHQSLLRIESEKSNLLLSNSGEAVNDKEGRNSGGSPPGQGLGEIGGPDSPIVPPPPKLTSLKPASLKLGDAAAALQPLSGTPAPFKDGSELSTFVPARAKLAKPDILPGGKKQGAILNPEWFSSGGVYPDDSTNGTGEYYGEEYESLINSNNAENKEEGRRLLHRKRINVDLFERFANLSIWQNRMRQREQQVQGESRERESRMALAADVNSMSTEPPEAIMAQNELADVISRGRIDSVMYVYFGDRYNDYHKEEIAGRVIQAVGGVIAAIAQVLTVLGAAKCVRKSTQTNQLPVHLHIGFALLISNLLLLLAVHATEPADVCATVAMILHYLHLVIGCWLFAHTVRTYVKLRKHAEAPDLISSEPGDRPCDMKRPLLTNNFRYTSASWTAPLPFIFMSYLANPDGYETRHYCWMSIEKGMVISFILPIFLLIGANTFLVVLSLRHLLAQRKLWADSSSTEMDEDTLDERRISSGIRASAMLLPLLAIMWFLGVVALENASSIFFQIASASANIALSWLVLYFLGDEVWPELCCIGKRDQSTLSLLSSDEGCHSVQPGAHLFFDNEPLLAASSAPVLPLPSTSSAYGVDVSHSVCKPVPSTSSTPLLSSAPSTSRGGKRFQKSLRRPNWSTPGGNEIYELKMDAISTICT